MTSVIGIDPGVTTGFALFVNGRLSRAYARPFAEFIEEVCDDELYSSRYVVDPIEIVLEFPKWRPHSKEQIDDLLGVAHKAGRIEQFYAQQQKHVQLVWPHVWKGSVPKDVHNARVLKLLAADELALLPRKPRSKKHPYDHNMVDAIGLGLWKLGRLR